jgi:hypothetical protein
MIIPLLSDNIIDIKLLKAEYCWHKPVDRLKNNQDRNMPEG